jgi:hypothetical protein
MKHMFRTVYQFLGEDSTRVLYLLIALFVLLMVIIGCSVGKVAFQAEDIKVEKPYVSPSP